MARYRFKRPARAILLCTLASATVSAMTLYAHDLSTNIIARQSNSGARCPWRNTEGYHCDQPASVYTNMTGADRWRDTACDCAWADFLAAWEEDRKDPGGLTFSRTAAEFFMADGSWTCGSLEMGCYGDSMPCLDTQVNDETGPAGTLIMSSFSHVSRDLNTMDYAIDSARAETRGEYRLFYKTFMDLNDPDELGVLSLTVDALGILFSIFSTPFLNQLFQTKGGPSEEQVTITKERTYEMAAWARGIATDAARALPETNADTMALDVYLYGITKAWRAAVGDLNAALFSGEGEGLDFFQNIISEGKNVLQGMTREERGTEWGNDVEEERRWGERVIYSAMIPRAWYAGGWSPVILDTGKNCDEDDYLVGRMMSSTTAESAKVCYEDKLYFLVSPALEWESRWKSPSSCFPGNPGGPYVCWQPGRPARNFFQPLPGFDDLHSWPGKTDRWGSRNEWGGITIEDMVIGSLNSREVNGGKNGAAAILLDSADNFKELYDEKDQPVVMRAPGIFRFPICSPEEATSGWKNTKDHRSDEDKDDSDARRYWPCKKP